jgi:hypothetical protein
MAEPNIVKLYGTLRPKRFKVKSHEIIAANSARTDMVKFKYGSPGKSFVILKLRGKKSGRESFN